MKYSRKKPNLDIGDLVYHLLYGRTWVAVILDFGAPLEVSTNNDITLVHLQPGSEYDGHFKQSYTKYRITDNSGYVSTHWLRPLVTKKPLPEGKKT